MFPTAPRGKKTRRLRSGKILSKKCGMSFPSVHVVSNGACCVAWCMLYHVSCAHLSFVLSVPCKSSIAHTWNSASVIEHSEAERPHHADIHPPHLKPNCASLQHSPDMFAFAACHAPPTSLARRSTLPPPTYNLPRAAKTKLFLLLPRHVTSQEMFQSKKKSWPRDEGIQNIASHRVTGTCCW